MLTCFGFAMSRQKTHTGNLMAHAIWSCWNALSGRAVLHFPWIGVTYWFVTVMFAGWQVKVLWQQRDNCMHLPHTPVLLHTHAHSLSANKTVYPERTPGLLMHTDVCWSFCVCTVSAADPFYTQDIKMSLWPDGVLVIWALCVRSNCNFASGGIAVRQTDGMSCINIFMLEALLTSVGRVACVCCIDVRRFYLLTSKPGMCNCNDYIIILS